MLPERTAIVTAGVDLQDDRVEVSVYAWTKAEECWLMAHQVIPGDPSTPALWAALDGFLLKPWARSTCTPCASTAAAIKGLVGLPFFEQLTSEYLKTGYRRGRPERSWERRKGRAAEAWDCSVYAVAAIHGLASHGVSLDIEADRVELD